MEQAMPKILFIEDDKIDRIAVERFLKHGNFPFELLLAGSIAETRAILRTARFDAAVVDYILGDGTAFDLFEDLPDTPMILITGIGNEEIAVKAMKSGAYDYLIKDAEGNYLKTLALTVENALKRKETEAELIRYREHLEALVARRTAELQREVEERKRAEEALRKAHDELEMRVNERTAELSRVNAELARANRLKDEFLANMSHELRTPLNVILGMAEALQEGIHGSLNEKQRNALRTLEESGRHLLTLINDVLDLSKIGAGKLELEIMPVTIQTICQASLRMIKQMAHKKQVNIATRFDPAVTTLRADGRRLKQILVNLLSNAVKFTPAGGEIGLEVQGDPEQHVVSLTVWDTGIGIAPEDMNRLFQPFVQLDASLARKYEGSGLGLSLVYRMVEMHGGSVTLKSEVGKGSRFTISLPWQEVEGREVGRWGDGEEEGRSVPYPDLPISPTPQLPNSPAPRTMLIAEDNEATIATFSGYFDAKGYRVLIARNGWEAFAHAREYQPDVIVMDIQMPDMDGLEAIRHIRSDKQGQAIPIIALTALAMDGDRERCLAAGADDYLGKPVNLKRLTETIERLLTSKSEEF